MVAKIIYYADLDYEKLPTAKKRRIHHEQPITITNGQPPTPSSLAPSPSSATFIYIPDDDSQSPPQPPPVYTPNEVPKSNYTSPPASNLLEDDSYDSLYLSTAAAAATPPQQKQQQPHQQQQQQQLYTPSSATPSSFVPASHYSPTNFSPATREPLAPRQRKQPVGVKGDRSSYSVNNNNSQPQHQQQQATIVTKELLMMTLKRYFKFDSFRENQFEAVDATCKGLDTLILMPTGGGKSICYQLPAILSEGVSIVVSPLKSLIADQVDRLRRSNIRTFALFGDTPDQEVQEILGDLQQAQPKVKLLYVTPEKISASNQLMSIFDRLYQRNLLARFVIDEAHCVSMWGSDFRPDYRKLNKLRQLFPSVPIMALTATAPPKVRLDILDQLMMDRVTSRIFIQSFNRPNLKFEVRIKGKGCVAEICNLIHANFTRQCGIIYCLSRADCENLAEKLRERGIASAPYHAGLNNEHRNRVFGAWSRGSFQVVCATIAFGMGIDKSDVRFVIHYSMPKSLEGYYQEAGRAGRDGKFASCILYFSKSDLWRMKSMLGKTGFGRKKEDKERDTANLQPMIDYVDNRGECRRTVLLRYLGEKFDSQDCIRDLRTACDNCLARQQGA